MVIVIISLVLKAEASWLIAHYSTAESSYIFWNCISIWELKLLFTYGWLRWGARRFDLNLER